MAGANRVAEGREAARGTGIVRVWLTADPP